MSFPVDTNVVSAVTRNTAPFDAILKALLNPWT